MAAVSFLFDEHMSNAIARELRRHGADVVTAMEAGLRTRSDDAYLPFALATGRVLVTLDQGFVIRHYMGERHAGIVHARPNTVTAGEFIGFLLLLFQSYEAHYMLDRLEQI